MAVELILVAYVLGGEGTGMGARPLAREADAGRSAAAQRVERIGLSAPFTMTRRPRSE